MPRFEDRRTRTEASKGPRRNDHFVPTSKGKSSERVAADYGTPYDLAFTPTSKPVSCTDADMEADIGHTLVPSHRVDGNHEALASWMLPVGRKCPKHYFDRLPNLLDTGRAAPRASNAYEHHMPGPLPTTASSWPIGRRTDSEKVRLKPGVADIPADPKFPQGHAVNVTAPRRRVPTVRRCTSATGGRGTARRMCYRVEFIQGKIPDAMKQLGQRNRRRDRQPQLDGRLGHARRSSDIRHELRLTIGTAKVAAIAYSEDNPPAYRIRAY